MFEYLLDNGARLDIKNRQNFTPLTLAAKLARAEVMFSVFFFLFLFFIHFYYYLRFLNLF